VRHSIFTLLFTILLVPVGVVAQGRPPGEELTLSVAILTLTNPIFQLPPNPDGTLKTTGPELWIAIKDTTAVPYGLCTKGHGGSWSNGNEMSSGASRTAHCGPYWLLIPGETLRERYVPPHSSRAQFKFQRRRDLGR
jgi:hypothetical protein